MGLNLCQLFLRDTDFSKLFSTIGAAWADLISQDTEHPVRQLALLQTGTPWTAVVDSTSQVPRELTRIISARCGGQAVWVSVSSMMLSYSLLKAVEGELILDRTIPDEDPEGLLPLYVDAEWEAWDWMAGLGIPEGYRLLRVREIDHEVPAGRERGDLLLFQRPGLGQPVEHAMLRQKLTRSNDTLKGPPTEYSIAKLDEKRLYDLYVISGRMTDDRVDHLLRTFDTIGRRKLRPDGHLYLPVITHSSGDKGESERAREFLLRRFRLMNADSTLSFQL